MKTVLDQLPIELCKKLIETAEKLPSNVQLYWARNEEKILEVLNTEEIQAFEPVTFGAELQYLLPAVGETTRKKLWYRHHVPTHFMPEFFEKVFKKYDAEPPIHISSCTLHCSLKTHECFSELGIADANDLANTAFTFPQIAGVLSRHRGGKEKASVLTYEGWNCFPIVVPGGAVEFVSACSIHEFGRHKKWRAWFMGSTPNFTKGKILFKEAAV